MYFLFLSIFVISLISESAAACIVLTPSFKHSERFFSPSVFFLDLGFFLGSKIIFDVKVLADFNNRLILDLRGDFSARELEKGFDIEVVGCHDQLKELFLLKIYVVRVPLVNNLSHVAMG